MYKHYYKKLIL